MGEHTFNELLQTALDDTTRLIAIGAIVLTLLIVIGVAVVRDLGKYSKTEFDKSVKTCRAQLLRKYVENAADPDENDGLAPDTRASENHYRASFAIKGQRRPLVLEMLGEEWKKLPEAGNGLLEYSAGLLIAFKPEDR